MSIRGSCWHTALLLAVILGLILIFVMLGMECRAFSLLGKCVSTLCCTPARAVILPTKELCNMNKASMTVSLDKVTSNPHLQNRESNACFSSGEVKVSGGKTDEND